MQLRCHIRRIRRTADDRHVGTLHRGIAFLATRYPYLRQLSEAIQRVDVWRLDAVKSHKRLVVQLHALDCFQGGFLCSGTIPVDNLCLLEHHSL